MAQDSKQDSQLSSPQSIENDPKLEYRRTPMLEHSYTLPRSHPNQYSYGDPADFEMAQKLGYAEHPAFYPVTSYHTPPAPILSGVQTRSGKSLSLSPATSTSSPSTRYSRSPKPKKAKLVRRLKEQPLPIDQPLSIMTRDYDVPVMDMMAWANRKDEERYKEVDTKHKGKIPRPMNSFMLYRTAFKERIKKWGKQGDNNQLISKVAGLSWPMEPSELRDYYAECANVERDNHAKAFPTYKFAPNKNPKKRGRGYDDSDDSDPDWDGDSAYSSRRPRRRDGRDISRSLSSTPASFTLNIQSDDDHMSPYQTLISHEVPHIIPADQWGRPIQYHPIYTSDVGYQYQPQAYEMTYAPTSYPHQSAYASQLVGMPPITAEDDLLGASALEHSALMIDPGLGGFSLDGNYQYGSYAAEHQLQDFSRSSPATGPAEARTTAHPGMQMLTTSNSPWSQAQSNNAFDAEFNQWETTS